MQKATSLLFLFITILLLESCSDSNIDKPGNPIDSSMIDTLDNTTTKDTIVVNPPQTSSFSLSTNDKKMLSLFLQVNLGNSFVKIKEQLPTLKGIRPEENKDELADKGLTESINKIPLFGAEAVLEFNFKQDSLYSFSYTFPEKTTERAEEIMEAIKAYYSNSLGESKQERVEEDNRFNQIFYWPAAKSAVPFLNFNLNSNTIVWGKRVERYL